MPAPSANAPARPADRVTTGSARAVAERPSPAAALTLAVIRSTAAGAAVARLTRTLVSGKKGGTS